MLASSSPCIITLKFCSYKPFTLCSYTGHRVNVAVVGAGKDQKTWESRYPFIKRASSFSSPESVKPGQGGGDGEGYDYIIVGGGTAGCPLAATLSQKYSVLVLERGGAPFGNVNVSFMQNFHISLADTSSSSASQFFVSTDGVFNSRARVLGGGTSINAGFYTRASSRYVQLPYYCLSFLVFTPFFFTYLLPQNADPTLFFSSSFLQKWKGQC